MDPPVFMLFAELGEISEESKDNSESVTVNGYEESYYYEESKKDTQTFYPSDGQESDEIKVEATTTLIAFKPKYKKKSKFDGVKRVSSLKIDY